MGKQHQASPPFRMETWRDRHIWHAAVMPGEVGPTPTETEGKTSQEILSPAVRSLLQRQGFLICVTTLPRSLAIIAMWSLGIRKS